MTLKDIAVRAGVSVSTVSRIINSPDNSFARKEVRDKVWAVIKETGYVPNPTARALKQGHTGEDHKPYGSIACILGRAKNTDDNPFFAQLARIIEQQAMEHRYPVRFSCSVFDFKTKQIMEKVRAGDSDGAIVLGRLNENTARFLEQHYKNIVYVGRNEIPSAWDQVLCDGYKATQLALEHLISYGHRRIGYIGEAGDEIRYKAYLDTLHAHGIKKESRLIIVCSQNNTESGYQAADKLLFHTGTLPTAVFCASDILTIAALRRFREAKIKVPDRLSLISMDNIELSGYASPMLTTVEMPIEEMGNVAVRTLISRIQKHHHLPLKIHLPVKLLNRESVANLNEGMYI